MTTSRKTGCKKYLFLFVSAISWDEMLSGWLNTKLLCAHNKQENYGFVLENNLKGIKICIK
jgi:hypothetical protein